jgi:hypothetical protein
MSERGMQRNRCSNSLQSLLFKIALHQSDTANLSRNRSGGEAVLAD